MCASSEGGDGDSDSSGGSSGGATNSSVKLPILQIFKASELVGEFICGNDLQTNIDKFRATLPTIVALAPAGLAGSSSSSSSSSSSRSSSTISASSNVISFPSTPAKPSKPSAAGGTSPNDVTSVVQNVYSDDQLTRAIGATDGVVVLKLFRDGCKKCAKLEPVYEELAQTPAYAHFQWLQAEVVNVGGHTKRLKERLLGLQPEATAEDIESCAACNSTGFITCPDCQGTGYVKKGTVAAYCSTCVGYKKVRCNVCGGKCLKCTIGRSDGELVYDANMD